ncbi:MAG: 3-dehydroquinate synthase [Chlamydiales bacterium]|nr:3-dehydroquinate synthase [Chlamydiales bacterium]
MPETFLLSLQRQDTTEVFFDCDLFSIQVVEDLRQMNAKLALFCDKNIANLLGYDWQSFLRQKGIVLELFLFEPGEKNKNHKTKELLENQLFEQEFGRDSCFIALGGGVTIDLIGFIAATYMRGVPFICIPTTLLAMVDAAIGGKNAINTAYGKNLLGTFYFPRKIYYDFQWLSHLPKKEWIHATAEIIKYAITLSYDLFLQLENGLDQRDLSKTMNLVKTCILLKHQIVSCDFTERLGIRSILNFGHTIGHALEKITDFQMAHGEAVAMGMLVESYISWKMGFLSYASFTKIQVLICSYEFPLAIYNFQKKLCLEMIKKDKKVKKGVNHLILLQEIGLVVSSTIPIPMEFILEGLNWLESEYGKILY